MRRPGRRWLAGAAGALALAAAGTRAAEAPAHPAEPPAAVERGGLAVEGSDRARIRLGPALAAAAPAYANAGYRLAPVPGADAERLVEVDLAPLETSAPCPPPPPARAPAGEVERRAREAVAGATTCYEAVSAVLGWLVHHVVDAGEMGPGAGPVRPAAPDAPAAAVLAAGEGDAWQVARLAVAMLAAAGVEARLVDGWVTGDGAPGAPHGAHTWIEVRYPDRGWAFSDPLHHHHYVPARYVRLASPVAEEAAPAAELLARQDERSVVDLYRAGGPGVTARRGDARQVAAVLRVVVSGAPDGVTVLTGDDGVPRRKALLGGESVFVGLAGGAYTLQVLLAGRPAVTRRLDLAPRERSAVYLGESEVESAGSAAPPGRRAPGGRARPPAPLRGGGSAPR
jgi:hypothetical protein